MSDADKKAGAASCGYRNPPAEHRFKKGVSGNPKGRPPKTRASVLTKIDGKVAFAPEDLINALAIEEAYRLITIRVGDRVEQMPLMQAALRKIALAAANGDPKAFRIFFSIVKDAEADRRAATAQTLDTALNYKERWNRVLAERKRTGATGPEPLLHPDDIIIDMKTGAVHIEGPVTTEQKEALDNLIDRYADAEQHLEGLKEDLKTDPDNLKLRREIREWERRLNMVRPHVAKRESRGETIPTFEDIIKRLRCQFPHTAAQADQDSE